MEKFKKIKKASILGIIGNTFLLIIKGSVGIYTGSEAMLADASNSMSDVFSSLLSFIGNKISSKPIDNDHHLGHGKAEYIYAMIVSIIMFLLSFELIKSAIKSLIYNEKYIFSKWLIIVCIITIIIKLLLYIYTRMIFKRYKSILLEANSKDHRNDCIITFANLISSILALNNIYFVDSLVSIAIALWIFISGAGIFKRSYDVLMDKAISDDIKNQVLQIALAHKEIKKINHFNSTPIGYLYQISLTIFVDGNLSTFESHKIADSLEDEINEKIPEIYLTVIHVNPIDLKRVKK